MASHGVVVYRMRTGLLGEIFQWPVKLQTLVTLRISDSVSGSTPPLLPPRPRPSGPRRPVVDVCWIGFAQTLLKIGKPAGGEERQDDGVGAIVEPADDPDPIWASNWVREPPNAVPATLPDPLELTRSSVAVSSVGTLFVA